MKKRKWGIITIIIIICILLSMTGYLFFSLANKENEEKISEDVANMNHENSKSTDYDMTEMKTFNFETKTVTLNSGYEMPLNGIGTYSLTGEECYNSITSALNSGVRLIDTAYMYHNEEEIGRAVRDSNVPREEIFITTKLYPNQYADPEYAIDLALETLDVEYIDLLLLHHPGENDVKAYKAMEQAFAIESFATYYIATWIISKIYLKGAIGTVINTNNMKAKKNTELKLSECKQRSPKRAFLSKELKQIMRTPIFCLQCIILPMVYPILFIGIPAIALISFARSVGFDFLTNMQENIFSPIGICIAISIAQVLYIMNFTSIIAISREGKKAKLMKTIPISLYKQFKYKLYPALIADSVIACIVTICYSLLVSNMHIVFSIFLFITLMALCLMQEKVMILIDLKKPKITWTSEYAMMKENVNVMYEFFYAVVVVILLTGIGFMINNITVLMIVVFLILALINLAINQYVKKNQIKLYRKIF